jgi:membrane peptidoglycan carboxypeptidase
MAAAYAAFAANGQFCAPRAVTEILDQAGQPLPLPDQPCQQVVEPRIANTVTSVMTGVIDGPRGTGKGASIGRPAAGKTGTTNSSRAAWFVGYTPQLATAVWVGQPGGPGKPVKPMQRVRINGRYYPQVYGGTIPAAIWRRTMSAAMQGVPVERFAQRDPDVVDGERSTVPDVTGQSTEQARQTLTEAGFGVRVGDTVSGSASSRGTVAYTSPRAGREASPGRTVTLYVSNGRTRRTPTPAPTRQRQPAPAPEEEEPTETPESTPARGNNGNGNGNGGND